MFVAEEDPQNRKRGRGQEGASDDKEPEKKRTKEAEEASEVEEKRLEKTLADLRKRVAAVNEELAAAMVKLLQTQKAVREGQQKVRDAGHVETAALRNRTIVREEAREAEDKAVSAEARKLKAARETKNLLRVELEIDIRLEKKERRLEETEGKLREAEQKLETARHELEAIERQQNSDPPRTPESSTFGEEVATVQEEAPRELGSDSPPPSEALEEDRGVYEGGPGMFATVAIRTASLSTSDAGGPEEGGAGEGMILGVHWNG